MQILYRVLILIFVFSILLPKMEGAMVLAKSIQKLDSGSTAKDKEQPVESESEKDSQEEENETIDEYHHKYPFEIQEASGIGSGKLTRWGAYYFQQPLISKYPDITTPPPENP